MSRIRRTEGRLRPVDATRRDFLKWSAFLGGATAASGGGLLLSGCGHEAPAQALGGAGMSVVRTANTPECLHCAMLAHVEDGRLVKVTGDPDFNIMACARGISRIRQLYSPHRLKYPMKRVGARGEDKWERITWDEALDTIADRYRKIRDEHGNEAFLAMGGTGNWSTLSTGVLGLWSGFWNQFGGATPVISQLCCASVTEGFNAVFGGGRSEFRDEWIHSRYFLAWGNNPAVSNNGYMKNLFDAREKHGARLVTIDPRLSETAAMSDRWIQIRPGTDAALALGMIRVLIEEGHLRRRVRTRTHERDIPRAPGQGRCGPGGLRGGLAGGRRRPALRPARPRARDRSRHGASWCGTRGEELRSPPTRPPALRWQAVSKSTELRSNPSSRGCARSRHATPPT